MKSSFFRQKRICARSKFLLHGFLGMLLLCGFSVSMKTDDLKAEDDANIPREKIYLHIDRNLYNSGEDIWFKVFLVDANTNKPTAQSKVVYVELINPAGKITSTKIIKIAEGGGAGDFKLPFNLIHGAYTVRAYTNYMRNFDEVWFFSKILSISSLQDGDASQVKFAKNQVSNPLSINKPDLQFFPEGGNMVYELVNHIGFNAIGADGKGIDISGTIIDNSGEQVMEFKTLKFGMGELKFVPQRDKSYKADIIYNGEQYTYNLPAPLSRGVVMEIIEQKDFYVGIIRSTLPNGVRDFKFIGRQKNRIFGSSQISNSQEGAKITIPKNMLEEGIAQFTLFDNEEKPLCERLVFVEPGNDLPGVVIANAKQEYRQRELVELELSMDTTRFKNVTASVSVTGISGLDSGIYAMDIRSYLLLSSDLQGEVEHPGYYFHSDDPFRKNNLDLLMMTQGWRQFILEDSLHQNFDKQKFAIEQGITIGGSVSLFSATGRPAKAEVSLTYSNEKELVYNQTQTDNAGHFLFEGFDFQDSTSVIIQAKKITKGNDEPIKNPNGNFYITMDSITSPGVKINRTRTYQSEENIKERYPENNLPSDKIDSILPGQQRHIQLPEVTVEAKKGERIAKKRSMYFESSQSVDFKEVRNGTAAQNILEALEGRVAGMEINGEEISLGGNNSVQNGGDPLFLLDGMPVSKGAILSIPVNQVDFVDVLKRSRATIFGPSGSHGVIAVYTLTAADNLANRAINDDKCILHFIHPGYSFARKFYEPVYTSDTPHQDKPDHRATIYWNPEVKMTGQGKAKISFYTTDLIGTYNVHLEGVTSDGIPVNSETFFDVK